MPIVVLAGEEELELSRRLDTLKKKLLDPSWVDLNLTVLANPDLRQISDAAAMLPFGPGNRMVLIEQCSLFTKSRGKAKESKEAKEAKESGESKKSQTSDGVSSPADGNKGMLDFFEQALAAVAPNTYLVFSCPYNFDSSLKVSKVVSKYAAIENFPRQRYWVGGSNQSLEAWCRKEAHRHGATIDNDAINFLLESTEADLRLMSSEIEKAATYLLPRTKITLEVVSHLSTHFSHAFSLLDHWARGNRALALNDVDELLARRSGVPVIALLNTSLSKWINIKALSEQRMPPAQLAGQLNMKPFVLNLELTRIKNLSLDYLIKKRVQLARLETLVKTGQLPDQHALAMFVAT